MTDRQVTESTVGLAGRLSRIPYGLVKAEDCGWLTTRNFPQNTPVLKELGPRKTWIPANGAAGAQPLDSSASTAWQASRKQQRWLMNTHPEARLGNECLLDQLISSHSSQSHGTEPRDQSLFAIGEVTNISEPRRVCGEPLIAIASGIANDTLRLVKPKVEQWQWGDDANVSLLLSNVVEGNESIHVAEEFAGPIRRLKSVVGSKRYDPTRWIVVQRDSGTRVFQPEYQRFPMVSKHSGGGKPSRIAANPLFFLPKDQTGGSPHSDVAFNPGVRARPPQLGLIDECGVWSIWDVTHMKVKSTGKPKVSLRKCGHIEKGVLDHLPSRCAGEAQWYKMLWVGCKEALSEESQDFDFDDEDADFVESQGSFPPLVRSSTLLLCSPKLVKLLDLTNNAFLPDLPFVRPGSRDCIVDVHENPQDTQYVFVLTSLKLFVVRVHSAPGEDGEARKHWTIVLSVSHLRDGFNGDLKLTVAPGAASPEQVSSLVSIYSSSNTRVDLYCITMVKNDPSRVAYHSEVVVLDALQGASPNTTLQSMCLHPAPVVLKEIQTEFARRLSKKEVRFYQLAILGADMCLISTLCASAFTSPVDMISHPDREIRRGRKPKKERKRLLKHIMPLFVVQEDIALDDEGEHGKVNTKETGTPARWPVLRRPVRLFYEHLRAAFNNQVNDRHDAVDAKELFDHVHLAVEQAIENGNMPATTLLQMVENFRLPSDISLATTDWGAQVERLRDIDSSVPLLALDRPQSQITRPATSLEGIYSALLDMTANDNSTSEAQGWILDVRSAAFRQMACDIYLSLYGLVYRQMDLNESQQTLARDLENMLIDSQQGSVKGGSSRAASVETTTSSKTEIPQTEDPAMTLLRSYTGTGKFVPAKRTALLDKWEVGANPEDYVFDLDRDQEETPGMLKRAKQLARASRKRRRAETLLRDQEPTLPATQPAQDTRFFSSQALGASSQTQAIMSDPLQTMSQPMSGFFGRRPEPPKKKAKKRKAGF